MQRTHMRIGDGILFSMKELFAANVDVAVVINSSQFADGHSASDTMIFSTSVVVANSFQTLHRR